MLRDAALTDGDLPGFWHDSDQASLKGQLWTLRYARLRLLGVLVAAFGGSISFASGNWDIGGVLVLVGFGAALGSELTSWVHQPDRRWYDGRALAESAKTLAWRYAVGAEPFPLSLAHGEAEEKLRERMRQVADEVSDRVIFSSQQPVITSQMHLLRGLPFKERREAYIKGRTVDQHAWYSKKASTNRHWATAWRITLVVFEVAALILASLQFAQGWEANIAGFLAAVIAAGASWVALKQFSTLASAYTVAAKELAIQVERLGGVSEADWPQVVADAEEAISREHTTWVASRGAKVHKI